MFEHLGEHTEGAGGLVRRLAYAVVQFDDVAPLALGHPATADSRLDEAVDRSPVFVGRALLAMRWDILL